MSVIDLIMETFSRNVVTLYFSKDNSILCLLIQKWWILDVGLLILPIVIQHSNNTFWGLYLSPFSDKKLGKKTLRLDTFHYS
jgi:hypothetical protein